jgi:hypothetical protein
MLRRLVGEMAAGGECTAVLEAELGIPASALETNWLASLHPTTAPTTFFSENVLWLAIIAAGFAGMALMIWRPDGTKVAGKR